MTLEEGRLPLLRSLPGKHPLTMMQLQQQQRLQQLLVRGKAWGCQQEEDEEEEQTLVSSVLLHGSG